MKGAETMDDLTRRYAKALTTEAACATEFDQAKAWVDSLEAEQVWKVLEQEPKLAEWKARLVAKQVLVGMSVYRFAKKELAHVKYAHLRAKCRLTVIEDQVKRRRAREYGRES